MKVCDIYGSEIKKNLCNKIDYIVTVIGDKCIDFEIGHKSFSGCDICVKCADIIIGEMTSAFHNAAYKLKNKKAMG